MKLKKDTPRWYEDACGTAFALELIGGRWALLIMRELIFGPRRFGELRAGLHGISAKALTHRLEGLEAAGIVVRRTLPPPASVQVYQLTPWGCESEQVMSVMGRWAVRSPDHDPTLPLSPVSLMLSLRTMFSAERAAGFELAVGFRLGVDEFVARVGDGAINIERGPPDALDVLFDSDPQSLAAVVYGGQSLDEMEAGGRGRVSGDRARAQRFVQLFPLPPKFVRPKAQDQQARARAARKSV